MKRLFLVLFMLFSSVARADFVSKTCITDLGGCFYYHLDSVRRQHVYYSETLVRLLSSEVVVDYAQMGIGVSQLDPYHENLLSPMLQKIETKSLGQLQSEVVDLGEDAILAGIGCVAAVSACGAVTNPGTFILIGSACVGAEITCRFAMKNVEKWQAKRKEYWKEKKEHESGGSEAGNIGSSGSPGFSGIVGSPAAELPIGTVISVDCPDGGCQQ